MKKVFLSLAVLFSVALVSCGGNKANEENTDSVAAEQVEVVDVTVDTVPAPDSNGVDTVVNAEVAGAEVAEVPAEAGK